MSSGRKTRMPLGTKIADGKLVLPGEKPRDAAQAKSWAKGGRKGKQRVLKKGMMSLLNGIGKTRG